MNARTIHLLGLETNEHETVVVYMLVNLVPTHVIMDSINQTMVEVIVAF